MRAFGFGRGVATAGGLHYLPSLVFRYHDTFPRPEGFPVWPETLPEYTPEFVELLIEELLASELPDQLQRHVVDHAEGNPFFLEELLSGLVDQGVLVRARDGWTASEGGAEITIPDSVQSVLASRIDLLPFAEKAALFPGTTAVRHDIVSCGVMATFLLRDVARRPLAFVASLAKRFVRRSREDQQVLTRGASFLPWLFRRLQATCVVLRKT